VPSDPESKRLLEFLLAHLYQVRDVPEPPPFPSAEEADVHGCVALGARLTPQMVLDAYQRGIFPMAEDTAIGWWSPDPRTILDFDTFHVSRRLARTIRQGKYEVRVDTAFDAVIAACGDREETWISPEIEEVYTALHHQGHVHSVETWEGERLVGGLYGVAIGGAFFGESMFHHEDPKIGTHASNVALVATAEHLIDRRFALFDVQYANAHIERFGVIEIPRERYLRRLDKALALRRTCARSRSNCTASTSGASRASSGRKEEARVAAL